MQRGFELKDATRLSNILDMNSLLHGGREGLRLILDFHSGQMCNGIGLCKSNRGPCAFVCIRAQKGFWEEKSRRGLTSVVGSSSASSACPSHSSSSPWRKAAAVGAQSVQLHMC